jgi:1,2-diacylglycerol 3-alpha-glucosyltransferase
MAFGLPVVAASAWGVPELVTDGVNGLLFPPRDLDAARSAIHRLLSLPPRDRSRLGCAGAALIRERHGVAGYAGAYRKLLHGLLDEPRELPGDLLAR